MNQQSLSSFMSGRCGPPARATNKQSDYGKVILPFTVLRRLDCVLEPTKAPCLPSTLPRKSRGLNAKHSCLRKAKQSFYILRPSTSKR